MVDFDRLMLNIVDDQQMDEGLGKLVSFGILGFVLSASGVVDGATFNKNMAALANTKKMQGTTLTITKSELKDVVEKSKAAKVMLGNWERDKALNVVARTLYMEARGEGLAGVDMVMTVIWNRAGGKPSNLADVCLANKQFSCWNDISNKTPSTYSIEFPAGALTGKKDKDTQMWNECVKVASSAIDGKFIPENLEWNAYYNPNTVKKTPSWDKDLLNTKMVGRHKVGQLAWITKKAYGTTVNPTTKTYTVKAGDTLYNIAGKDMKKVAQIKQLNGLKSDTINPGQVLKLV